MLALRLRAIITIFTLLCSVSAWAVCHSNLTRTAPSSRYTLMGSEVKDNITNLVWQRCSLGQTWDGSTCTGTAISHNWQAALVEVNALGGDWRLPNIKELQSLVERACYNPAINSAVFPNTHSGSYWSASPLLISYNFAWIVDFYYGNNDDSLKFASSLVRVVRFSQ